MLDVKTELDLTQNLGPEHSQTLCSFNIYIHTLWFESLLIQNIQSCVGIKEHDGSVSGLG